MATKTVFIHGVNITHLCVHLCFYITVKYEYCSILLFVFRGCACSNPFYRRRHRHGHISCRSVLHPKVCTYLSCWQCVVNMQITGRNVYCTIILISQRKLMRWHLAASLYVLHWCRLRSSPKDTVCDNNVLITG